MAFDVSQEIEKRQKLARDLDIRLKTVLTSLEVTEKEINHLTAVRFCLEKEKDFLKAEHVITPVFDFKKNKDDLNKTIKRLSLLLSDRIRVGKALDLIQKLVSENNTAYDKLLQRAENVVLSGHFGEDKDGQRRY